MVDWLAWTLIHLVAFFIFVAWPIAYFVSVLGYRSEQEVELAELLVLVVVSLLSIVFVWPILLIGGAISIAVWLVAKAGKGHPVWYWTGYIVLCSWAISVFISHGGVVSHVGLGGVVGLVSFPAMSFVSDYFCPVGSKCLAGDRRGEKIIVENHD